jgi:hypothetical protein
VVRVLIPGFVLVFATPPPPPPDFPQSIHNRQVNGLVSRKVFDLGGLRVKNCIDRS